MIEDSKSVSRSQADAGWKYVLEEFLEEVLAYSFPLLHVAIDWHKPWEFLDKELSAITQDNAEGSRFVDKLIRAHLKNGTEQWLLIHIEIQGKPDPDFSRRMFVYHYRIFDKFGKHAASCAILTDDSKSWRPEKYENNLPYSYLIFEFGVLKLLDLEKEREILENSLNPFSCIILTQLNILKLKRKSINEKYNLKLEQTKQLYKKGFSRDVIRKLYNFIDALIRLPENLELISKTYMIMNRETICLI